MAHDLVDLSLDKILLKCRVPGVTNREVVEPIPVKDQPPLNSYNPGVNATSASGVVVEWGDVVIPTPGLTWAPVVANEHTQSRPRLKLMPRDPLIRQQCPHCGPKGDDFTGECYTMSPKVR